MEKHVFESNVGTITVTPTLVTISHKRGTYHGGKSKDILIKSISGVEMKKPGMITAGHISILFSGGKEAGGRGAFEAAKNENTVMLGKKDFDKFVECKELIYKYMNATSTAPNTQAPTQADELAKWVTLRDSGVISADEFEAKKKQIIGL